MRICVSGTGSQGKSTFIEDFLKEWPTYTTPDSSYRSFVKNKHSKKGTKDMQWRILNDIVDEVQKHAADEKIIYDRGPLDNLAYTMYLFSKGLGKIDEKFVEKTMAICKESFKFIDIIYFMPITKVVDDIVHDNDKFQKDKKKGIVDEDFRTEVDAVFKALKYDWDVNMASNIFDPRDKPALIEIFGEPLERIQMCKYYLNVDGDSIDGDINKILTEAEIRQQQELKREFGVEDETTDEILKNPAGYQ